MSDTRYERVVVQGGKVLDRYTLAALTEAERRLGYPLTVVQGSYHGGVSASAGTHDGGGVVDLLPWDWQNKVRVLRAVGFAAWHRVPSQGPWSEHIHAVLIGNEALSPSAARQVTAYFNGRNGLANNGPDDFARPNPIPTFRYPDAPKVKAARIDGVDISHHQAGHLDFRAARKAKVRFVFHKATEGQTFVDDRYDDRRDEVRAAGLRWGAYHFARPGSSGGAEQARRFLRVAALEPGDMLPVLDLEDDGGLSKTQLTRWVGDFVRVCKARHGGAIIYTNMDLDDHFGCRLWVARYNNAMERPRVPAPWKRWTIWQFTDGEYGVPNTVPGLGHVDANTLAGAKVWTGLRLRRLRIRKPAPVEPPDPTPPPAPTPATFPVGTVNIPGNKGKRLKPPADGALAALKVFRKHDLEIVGLNELATPTADALAADKRWTLVTAKPNNLYRNGRAVGNGILLRADTWAEIEGGEDDLHVPLPDSPLVMRKRHGLNMPCRTFQRVTGEELTVFVVHIPRRKDGKDRRVALRAVLNHLASLTGPVLVLGDFNDETPDLPDVTVGASSGVDVIAGRGLLFTDPRAVTKGVGGVFTDHDGMPVVTAQVAP